jgi:hypothetical protein
MVIPAAWPLTAGSGGSPAAAKANDPEQANHMHTISGVGGIVANEIDFTTYTRDHPLGGQASVISLVAQGDTSMDGRVEAHGNQGVRITSGEGILPASNPEIQGVEIAVPASHQIKLGQGNDFDDPDQMLILGEAGAMIYSKNGCVQINAGTQITLGVGSSYVKITNAGVMINGILVKVN